MATSTIKNPSRVQYVEIQVTPGAGGQVNINTNTNYQVTSSNFINCVVSSPNYVLYNGIYCYSNYLYAQFQDYSTGNPYTSQITLRIFYIK